MSVHRAPIIHPSASLPMLSEAVVRRHTKRPLAFEVMYDKLRQRDPVAAAWLLHASETIASANTTEKSRYASLALDLFGMLSEQIVVNRLSHSYSDLFMDRPQWSAKRLLPEHCHDHRSE